MRESITIGNETFKTKKALTEFTRRVIGTDGYTLHNGKFMYDLITHHPDYAKKTKGKKIDYLYSGTDKYKTKTLFIVFEDGTKTDISWRKCISQRKSSYIHKLNCSMRDAVKHQITEFYSNLPINPICYLCGEKINQKYEELHIDHVIRFRDLVTAYNSRNSFKRPEKFKDGIGYQFNNMNLKYAKEWVRFHKENAVLAPTHASCNIERG